MADESARVKTGAALGSAAFFALAPGVVAGVVPWALTGWHVGSAPGIVRVAGAALTLAGAAVVVAEFVRFVREGRGRRRRWRPRSGSWWAGSIATCATRCTSESPRRSWDRRSCSPGPSSRCTPPCSSRWSPRSCASTRSGRCSISSAPSTRRTGARCPRGGRGCARGPGPRSGASLVPIGAPARSLARVRRQSVDGASPEFGQAVDQALLVVEGFPADGREVVRALAGPGQQARECVQVLRAVRRDAGLAVARDALLRGAREAIHQLEPKRGELGVRAPALDDRPQHRGVLPPPPRTLLDPAPHLRDRRLVLAVGQPRLRRLVAARHRSADEDGEHGVTALEVEVETRPGDAGGGKDVGDADVVEAPLGEKLSHRREDRFLHLPAR